MNDGSISGARGPAASGAAVGIGAHRAKTASFQDVLAAFEKEAAKSPAAHARDEVLKRHGLNEEAYKALPPDQKKIVDAEIALAVQRVVHADKGKGFKGAEDAASVAPGLQSSLDGSQLS